jgi:hypothetical protein
MRQPVGKGKQLLCFQRAENDVFDTTPALRQAVQCLYRGKLTTVCVAADSPSR